MTEQKTLAFRTRGRSTRECRAEVARALRARTLCAGSGAPHAVKRRYTSATFTGSRATSSITV